VHSQDGTTALMFAVRHQGPEVVKELLSWGADVNAVDGYGESVLTYADAEPRPELVELLKPPGLSNRVRGREPGLGGKMNMTSSGSQRCNLPATGSMPWWFARHSNEHIGRDVEEFSQLLSLRFADCALAVDDLGHGSA